MLLIISDWPIQLPVFQFSSPGSLTTPLLSVSELVAEREDQRDSVNHSILAAVWASVSLKQSQNRLEKP